MGIAAGAACACPGSSAPGVPVPASALPPPGGCRRLVWCRLFRHLVHLRGPEPAHLPRSAAPASYGRDGNRPDLAIEAGAVVACPHDPLLPRRRCMDKADIAALLALGAAFSSRSVTSFTSARRTRSPTSRSATSSCSPGCCATAGGGWAAWWLPLDSGCRRRRWRSARCCWCRR